MTLSTHVLDLSTGRPAAGVDIVHEVLTDDWRRANTGVTDADGRLGELAPNGLQSGRHRLTFAIGAYFASQDVASFHPEATVTFEVTEPAQHHHVPLLVSPFGYTTYRGS